MARYKCKECQTDVFHDRSGIEAHMERHPKLTLESYSEKYETAVEQKAEKKGKETASEKVPVQVQMKAEVVEKSTDSDPMLPVAVANGLNGVEKNSVVGSCANEVVVTSTTLSRTKRIPTAELLKVVDNTTVSVTNSSLDSGKVFHFDFIIFLTSI